jgi:GNAT superfamily N-acetyltransferase
MANLLYTVSTALGGKVGLLEDMVVRPEFRGQGVGLALLSAAIEYAQQVGCLRLTLLTDVDNLSAQQFYQRAGFAQSSMVPMRLSLKTTHN